MTDKNKELLDPVEFIIDDAEQFTLVEAGVPVRYTSQMRHMDGPEELGKALDALADTFDAERFFPSPIFSWAVERHKAQGKKTYFDWAEEQQRPTGDGQHSSQPRFK